MKSQTVAMGLNVEVKRVDGCHEKQRDVLLYNTLKDIKS